MGQKENVHHPFKSFRRSLRNSHRPYLYSILTLVLLYLVYRWLSSPRTQKRLLDLDREQELQELSKQVRPSAPGLSQVKVDIYLEAQCGDSTRFMRRQLWPTYEKFMGTGALDVFVIAFGKASCQPEAGDYNCRCQHGQRECDLNQLMNCVQDFYNNDATKYMPVLSCIQGKTDLDYAKDYCIANNPELPLDTIMKCTTGRRGRLLMALAGQKTAALQPPLENVPLIYVNGEKSLDAFYEFQDTICAKMNPKPEQCNTAAPQK